MHRHSNRVPILLAALAVTQLQFPGLAMASGLPKLKTGGDIEYLNVTPTGDGGYSLRMGDHPISSDRFIDAVKGLDASPALMKQVKAEQNARTALGLTSLGLVAIAPVFLGLFVTNYQRKPDGVFTRTWLAASAVDLAAAAGVGVIYLMRSGTPPMGYDAARDAARSYNQKLDALDRHPD